MTEPTIVTVHRLGNSLMRQHGLLDAGWTFELGNRVRSLGTCYYGRKTIEYSKHFLHVPEKQIRDTILHEIAHALVGPKHGHGNVWKSKAIEVGARPVRCAPYKTSAQPNYVIQCPNCKRKWYRHRLKKAVHRAMHCGVTVEIYKMKG